MKKILIACFAFALIAGVQNVHAQAEEKSENKTSSLKLEETKTVTPKSSKMKNKKACGKKGKKSCCSSAAKKSEEARKED